MNTSLVDIISYFSLGVFYLEFLQHFKFSVESLLHVFYFYIFYFVSVFLSIYIGCGCTSVRGHFLVSYYQLFSLLLVMAGRRVIMNGQLYLTNQNITFCRFRTDHLPDSPFLLLFFLTFCKEFLDIRFGLGCAVSGVVFRGG